MSMLAAMTTDRTGREEAEGAPTPGSSRLVEAFAYALELHGDQRRKGTTIPNVAHLLGVTSLVLEDGGDEDEAVAALLHDGPEDAGGRPVLDEIRRRFGDRVASLVEALSDSMPLPGEEKGPWRERKEGYIARLEGADDAVLRIALADKVSNARNTVADLEREGPDIWDRFNAGPADQAWYHVTLRDLFARRGARDRLRGEYEPLVDRLVALAAEAPPRPSATTRARSALTSEASRHGLEVDEALYDRLVQAASGREFVYYNELAELTGMDNDSPHFGAQLGRLLGDISRFEVAGGRPMLSSVVVRKEDHLPGKGFFALGEELRLVQPGEDEVSFAVRQIRATHDFWADRPPFGEGAATV
jgi:hypothetical protein